MLTVRLKKFIKSLHLKKFQQKYNKFIVETPKVVSELLLSENFVLDTLCATSEWIQQNPNLVSKIGDKLIEIEEKDLAHISVLKNPNQVLAVANKRANDANIIFDKEWCIYLNDLKDPGNIGTIIRTADWFGVKNVCFSQQSVDAYNSKIIQSSMGSFFRTNISISDEKDILESKRAIYPLAMEGHNIFKLDDLTPGIIVVGSESHGVSKTILDHASMVLNIPRKGKAESLNAAMACGIVLSRIVK